MDLWVPWYLDNILDVWIECKKKYPGAGTLGAGGYREGAQTSPSIPKMNLGEFLLVVYFTNRC